MCAWCPWKSEEDIRSPRTGVTEECNPWFVATAWTLLVTWQMAVDKSPHILFRYLSNDVNEGGAIVPFSSHILQW